jgi:hypothetical protein
MRYAYLDDKNQVVPTEDSNLAYETMANRRLLARDFVGDYCISTVFLEINHAYYEGGLTHFETYVFPAKDGDISSYSNVWGERADSYDEAMAAHALAVKLVKQGKIEERDDQ